MNSCNTPKWIPKHSNDIIKLFNKSKEIECELRLLAIKFSTEINLNLLDLYEFQQLIDESKKCLIECSDLQINLNNQIQSSSACKKLQRSPYKILLQKKSALMVENLRKRHYQFIFVINKIVKSLFDICSQSEIILDSALLLCNLFNENVEMIMKKEQKLSYGAKVCSNTFPGLLLQPKKIDIGMILQIISKTRSEQCCMSLISCLLATCKLELSPSDDNVSDTSSIQILRTLTSHLTSPSDGRCNYMLQNFHERQKVTNSYELLSPEKNNHQKNYNNEFDSNDPVISFFDNMANQLLEQAKYEGGTNTIKDELLEHVIYDTETFITQITEKSFKFCPSSFGETIDKYNQQDHQKWINRGIRSLWTQIGSTLDHVVLWWSDAPLCCRPVMCTKQLRDWLLLLSPDDAPEPILSTLKGLGETLTIFVTTTIWDQQFRLALVASSITSEGLTSSDIYTSNLYLAAPGTMTGNLWCELLNTLSTLCNSCDQNGTIPNQLPIVEQIPVLHRLDHSVHSMRIWAIAKAKSLCSEWSMSTFFKVAHHDIRNCLEHLQYLRFPEMVPADTLEVLIQVCVALRSKLISEIKANILKLKDTSNECIEILASTCRTYTLATLSLCFPSPREWRTNIRQSDCAEYVDYFLTKVYLPILQATSDVEILGLCLKIICESWLDHIYLKKVKFSRCGAINLLKDFDGVSEWIKKCPSVEPEHMEKLSKHEVLRMCEGVGRILLRKPDEIVSILPSPKLRKKNKDEESTEDEARLPPEMFVPNQKRWLELRARSTYYRNFFCICSGISVEN